MIAQSIQIYFENQDNWSDLCVTHTEIQSLLHSLLLSFNTITSFHEPYYRAQK